MSEGINNVQLLGNLGADPELKMTQGGTAVLKLRIATAERYQGKDGQWTDKTEWHSVTVWGKRAEGLHTFLAKGMQVYIEGGLHTSSYDKDGTKVYRTEVNARKVVVCGGKGGERSERAAAPATPRQPAAPQEGTPPDDFPEDSDLPF
ncbi:MAG: single-stranded DNA-binding protein [Brevundimonas sp.]